MKIQRQKTNLGHSQTEPVWLDHDGGEGHKGTTGGPGREESGISRAAHTSPHFSGLLSEDTLTPAPALMAHCEDYMAGCR